MNNFSTCRSVSALLIGFAGTIPLSSLAAIMLVDNFSVVTDGATSPDVIIQRSGNDLTQLDATMTNLGAANAVGDRTISVAAHTISNSNLIHETSVTTNFAGDDANFVNNRTNFDAVGASDHRVSWDFDSGRENVFAEVGVVNASDLRIEVDIGDDTSFGADQTFFFFLNSGASSVGFSGVLETTATLPADNSEPSLTITLSPFDINAGFDGSAVTDADFAAIIDGRNSPTSFEIDEIRITAVPEPSIAAMALGLGAIGVVMLRRRRS